MQFGFLLIVHCNILITVTKYSWACEVASPKVTSYFYSQNKNKNKGGERAFFFRQILFYNSDDLLCTVRRIPKDSPSDKKKL